MLPTSEWMFGLLLENDNLLQYWKKVRVLITMRNLSYFETQRSYCRLLDSCSKPSQPGDPIRFTLQWRHNGCNSVSNHQSRHCLLYRLFRLRSKKTSKLCITGICAGNSPLTGEFPAQRTSNAENASIWWRHHAASETCTKKTQEAGRYSTTYRWPLWKITFGLEHFTRNR